MNRQEREREREWGRKNIRKEVEGGKEITVYDKKKGEKGKSRNS